MKLLQHMCRIWICIAASWWLYLLPILIPYYFFSRCWLGDIFDCLTIKQWSKWKESWKASESRFSALVRDGWNSNTVLFLDLELRLVWNLHGWKILLVRKSKEIGSVPCPLEKQQRVSPPSCYLETSKIFANKLKKKLMRILAFFMYTCDPKCWLE